MNDQIKKVPQIIDRIIVKGLFGNVDYILNLSKLDDANYLMITGPIGYGKTLLLKMIYNALNYQKDDKYKKIFDEVEFSYFRIQDGEKNHITITKDEKYGVVFTCDGLCLSAGFFGVDKTDYSTEIDDTPQEKDLKWHFSDGNNVLQEDYYKRMLEHPSRGARHLFALYEFLFNAKEDVLLIDTPEAGVHMADLCHLPRSFDKVQKEHKKQIIVATHSPAFIDGRWDSVIDLFSLTREKYYNHE